MAPTVFNSGEFRYFFFSREETRMHVHVESGNGEAKFWLEPVIALASYNGLTKKDLIRLQRVIEERQNEIKASWNRHFKA
jgi:hypothetical protein